MNYYYRRRSLVVLTMMMFLFVYYSISIFAGTTEAFAHPKKPQSQYQSIPLFRSSSSSSSSSSIMSNNRRSSTRRYQNQNQNKNWFGDLWEEVIEFSTYGPAERKLLKAKREKKDAATVDNDDDVSVASFQQAQKRRVSGADATVNNNTVNNNKKEDVPVSSPSSRRIEEQEEVNSTSLQSFQSAVVAASKDKKKKKDDDNGNDEKEMEFDGYQLRDLMIEKWGVPLDVDFQRGYGGSTVYCTVLPVVGFGSNSRRCRHDSELAYLMHLQGVIEILQKYQNLDPFLLFLQTTKRTPKSGVESAPYLMDLDREALQQILEVR